MAISVAMPFRPPLPQPISRATLSAADKAKLLDAAAVLCGSEAVNALSAAIATHEALLRAKPAAYIRTHRSSGDVALSYDRDQDAAFAHEPLFKLPRVTPTMTGAL
ncbi:hypothetical protein [Hydrogenophaga sp.]|uniref:hypothetical protein n=1 Tax=Hydrogenophaga sp. TaxID=1904254 RepID=UPI002725B9F3|nr:hypothetical protein [Hydrogenophaga sp.]MDO9133983.1 hypothetical protein [Hydrogenophaga sp.]MDO9505994.1 hypothetical protein [Hydrogenophaga sp.]